jgi:hypothetical protein
MNGTRHNRKPPPSLEELRVRIERGRYEVKADRVAEAMLKARVLAPRGVQPRDLR